MTVAELIEKLSELSPNLNVFIDTPAGEWDIEEVDERSYYYAARWYDDVKIRTSAVPIN